MLVKLHRTNYTLNLGKDHLESVEEVLQKMIDLLVLK